MTTYHGGKVRGGDDIAQVIVYFVTMIEDSTGYQFKGYWEPFCGMCGVYRHIPELLPDKQFLASDIHPSLIIMWQALQDGWTPPNRVTEKMYEYYKHKPGSCPEKAYIGFGHSFGGIYFTGFTEKYGMPPSTKKAGILLDVADKLVGIQFKRMNYDDPEYAHMAGWIIYCDPPYNSDNSKFKMDDGSIGTFSSDDFWSWARAMSRNNLLFVSEYSAPTEFTKVFTREIQGNRMKGKNSISHECLYVHEKWLGIIS